MTADILGLDEDYGGEHTVTTKTEASERKPVVSQMYAKTLIQGIGAGTATAIGWALWTPTDDGGLTHTLVMAAGNGWVGGIAAATIGLILCTADRAVPGWSRRSENSSRLDVHLAAYIVLVMAVWNTETALAARQGAAITSFLMACSIMTRRLD